MQLSPVFLVLLDISGYTRFTRLHRTSSLHAEKIIGELLESVLANASHPLVIHELLGDEVTFFVASDANEAIAIEVRRQVAAIFQAFRDREAQLISECSLCTCEACATVGKLRLKAILHFGQAVLGQVGAFRKLSGEDVILVHRLLKNSVPASEYVLETEAFHRIAGPSPFGRAEGRMEHPEDLEPAKVHVAYPFDDAEVSLPAQVSLLQKLWQHVKIDVYTLSRRLGKRRRAFQNLEPPQE